MLLTWVFLNSIRMIALASFPHGFQMRSSSERLICSSHQCLGTIDFEPSPCMLSMHFHVKCFLDCDPLFVQAALWMEPMANRRSALI
jgi:hypothetical protein